MKKLPVSYFQQKDTLWLAKDLLGKVLITQWQGLRTSGRIVETEAYLGITDRASHAYGGRRTARTEIMYLPGGHAYVYLCYGIHHLFNVVTHEKGIPHAILIRALEPMEGIAEMLVRRKKQAVDGSLTRGPGSLSQAMGITVAHSGISLKSNQIFLAEDEYSIDPSTLGTGPRIGVAYAGEDASLPYRFFVKGHPAVSKPSR